MKLREAAYANYRGIQNRVEVAYGDTSIFVGRNDAGKSTLLRGLDLFLNNTEALPDITNAFSDSDICSIELAFEAPFPSITIDEAIPTSFEAELLLDENNQLRIKKEWDTTKSQIKPVTYIRRKSFGDEDFVLETERQLITRCQVNGIETQKANGGDFNNPEKREKLREHFLETGKEVSFVWEKLPTSGSTRAKQIHDQVKSSLPSFEYFRADTALSETEASIQRYFKGIASKAMVEAGIADVEASVREVLDGILGEISTKMNQVLPDSDQVSSSVNFDWSKGVQTGFKSVNDQIALPLNFRGDGFRRITMMSYFEFLAEDKAEVRNNLTAHFKDRLVELLQKGKSNSHIKQPNLSIKWNYWNVDEDHESDVGIDTTCINLQCADETQNLKDRVKTEIVEAKKIDGSIDPEWDNKLENYIEKANKFLEEIDDTKKYNNYLINTNLDKTCPVTLSVENDGNSSASDIRVEVTLPEWLLGFESYPNKDETPKIPTIPAPTAPRATSIMSALASINHMGNIFDHSLLTRNINRTSACSIKNNSIYFWADKLLHKHSITNRSERFFLLAAPNAPSGEIILEGRAFCSEYDDWHKIELLVNIV